MNSNTNQPHRPSVLEISELNFLGTAHHSPDGRLVVLHGDKWSASNPSDKWLVIQRDGRTIHQEKLPASVTHVYVWNTGLIILDLYNRNTGAASFRVIRENGQLLAKQSAMLSEQTFALTTDELWLIFDGDGVLKALDLRAGKVTKRKELPPLRHDRLEIAGPGLAVAHMFGGVVEFRFA